jgi:SAM-dependent methyltransferase
MAQGTVSERSTAPLDAEFDAYAERYEEACHRGLSLTGESREYFAETRVRLTANWCSDAGPVRRVLDFGCGVGSAAPLLRDRFENAELLGIDNSSQSIARANETFGEEGSIFATAFTAADADTCEVGYCNGVFHHIPPPERGAAVRDIFAALRPGGLFALWENNPWNPGTRIVMCRIPFDRDAILLWPSETRRLLLAAGFEIVQTSYHFYFPALLRALRPLEAALSRIPLGGQYCVLARKPTVT